MCRLIHFILALIKQDLVQSFRSKHQFIFIVGFFSLSTLMFPLSIGPETALLLRVGPGIIWVMALFSSSLGVNHVLVTEFSDGTLEMVALTNYPISAFVLAKALSHWILSGLPITFFSSFVAFFFLIPSWSIVLLILTLIVGTLAFSFIGVMGATLTLGAKHRDFMTAFLVFPLYIPVLIFGTSSLEAVAIGISSKPHLSMLLSVVLFSIPMSLGISALNLKYTLRSL